MTAITMPVAVRLLSFRAGFGFLCAVLRIMDTIPPFADRLFSMICSEKYVVFLKIITGPGGNVQKELKEIVLSIILQQVLLLTMMITR